MEHRIHQIEGCAYLYLQFKVLLEQKQRPLHYSRLCSHSIYVNGHKFMHIQLWIVSSFECDHIKLAMYPEQEKTTTTRASLLLF